MVVTVSKITTVYPAIIAKMLALYPTKTRLHNPYDVMENPEIVRKDAWGIAVEEASREEMDYCLMALNRTYKAVFVRQFVSLAGKEDGFDTATLAILEDQQTFCDGFFATDQIGQGANIQRIDIENISGINQVSDGEKKFLLGEVTFNILLSESIS